MIAVTKYLKPHREFTEAGAARALAQTDLPIGRIDVELSVPESELVLADPSVRPGKILALLRLHGHPVGIAVLDGRLGRSWHRHAPVVWTAVGDAVNAHLAGDGLPRVEFLAEVAREPVVSAQCLRWHEELLVHAPVITVVVATRDRPDSVCECLDALLLMEYPAFEVVVVDNDPTTEETATAISRRFGGRVRYVRENRRGLAAAHNRGLSAARGEIVAFVDDDVVVDRHWLTGIAEGFASGPDVACVTGLILPAQLETPAQLLLEQHGGFDKGFELHVFDTSWNRPADPLFPFTAGRFGSGANMAFDTAVLRGLGGFDPAIGAGTFARGGDDLAGFFRVVVAGHQLVYQPSAVVWHRHHREMAALRNQAYGYGVGLGAYLTSALIHEPAMVAGLVRRLPRGLGYTFGAASDRNRGRYDGLPGDLAWLEKRGVLFGPVAYAISRWRTRRASTTAGSRGGRQ
ncbi:glycosyltransferase [Nocardia sp. IBHARD005]|uniref:glycosyltransferase n=1 Tax=Nocardia sp. IBHARD005 TaxID=3457765 RepID=UPI004057E702